MKLRSIKPVHYLFATIAMSLTSLSQAAVYGVVQNDQSQIGFTYQQMGVEMAGRFQQFETALQFDTEQPQNAQIKLQVQLGSVDLGSPEFNAEVLGKDWFNTQAFPSAQFVSTAIKPLGGQQYEVHGTLSIKGQSQNITLPATFNQANDVGIFTGKFTIERGAFKIGEGMWSGFDIVANPVTVNFKITAKAN